MRLVLITLPSSHSPQDLRACDHLSLLSFIFSPLLLPLLYSSSLAIPLHHRIESYWSRYPQGSDGKTWSTHSLLSMDG